MKAIIKKSLPVSLLNMIRWLKRNLIRSSRRLAEKLGFNISRTNDFYSPLPTESQLIKNIDRWNKPSTMAGVRYDLESNKQFLILLLDKYLPEFTALPGYEENLQAGFGLGYTEIDALFLYCMIRKFKPQRYLEVGSGLSTYYSSLGAAKNAAAGHGMKITCVEPYYHQSLKNIPGVEVIPHEVQDVDINLFTSLHENDVLFIDSSHILRIDGDVPFLFLEVLPKLNAGVVIHIHDVPFPFNIPYPVEQWVLGKVEGAPYWPVYWNEAMLLQAFLAFNDHFEIIHAPSMIRYHDEQLLEDLIPCYKCVADEPNTFSSIWLQKVK